MSRRFQVRVFGFRGTAIAAFLTLLCSLATAADFTSLCADRAAIEHVYYNHRTGEKPPFEQTLPPAALTNLVQLDLRKEDVLKRVYAVEITSTMLDGEVQRINATTRAPDTLSEIKTALGNDPARFANSFAKPILVERLLREKFDNDDALHAAQRHQAELARHELLAAKTNGADAGKLVALLKSSHSNAVTQTTWLLTARPAETNSVAGDEIEMRRRFGPDAQFLSPTPTGEGEPKFYFTDLPPELQNVLRIQLRQAGDLSAVIETPNGFLFYVAEEKTDLVLSVAILSLPKRDYDQWLAEQAGQPP